MDDRDSRDEHEPLDDREDRESLRGVIPDLFRRALMSGIGTVFMTEDSIRKSLSDMKMPKEAMGAIIAQADKTKRELIATLARELRNFLDSLELSELLHDSLQDTTFEIHTKIRVKRNEDGGRSLGIDEQNVTMVKNPSKSRTRKSTKKKAKSEKPASKRRAKSDDQASSDAQEEE